MKEISTQAQLQATIAKPAALLKFTATWCGPCRAVAPEVDKLATQYSTVECAAIDLDKSQDLARAYQVTAVPTFIFFKNGKITKTIRGADIQAVRSEFAQVSTRASAMPKMGGQTVSGKPAAKTARGSIKPASGIALVDWLILYFRTLFSLDARATAQALK